MQIAGTKAGSYRARFAWYAYDDNTADQFNGPVATWTTFKQNLWGYFRPLTTGQQTQYGALYGRNGVEIHFRNWVKLNNNDRLIDLRTNLVYQIDGLPDYSDITETIVQAHTGKDLQ